MQCMHVRRKKKVTELEIRAQINFNRSCISIRCEIISNLLLTHSVVA